MDFVRKISFASFERASTPRTLVPGRARGHILPAAAVVHAALALLGCRRSHVPDLRPDPAAVPSAVTASRVRAQRTVEQIVPFESQLELMGVAPRVVPFEVQPTKVTVHVFAPGGDGAEDAVRKLLPALRHCGAAVKAPQKLTMKLRVGADGEVTDEQATPESDDEVTRKDSPVECVRRRFASMKITGEVLRHAVIELEVELAPEGPSYRDSHS